MKKGISKVIQKKKATQAATNGTNESSQLDSRALATAPTPARTREPEQRTLAPDEREEMVEWLNNNMERPFEIVVEPVSNRKRKRDAPDLFVQDDLWEDRLRVQYDVRPRENWEKLRKYKKFTVGQESIATGQCVLVKHDGEGNDDLTATVDASQQWKAKVLEVRALDTEHVYVRVAWLNRPEDLPGKRKQYYGQNELIPTNQMDIIDAMSVDGTFEIVHIDDSLEEDQDLDMQYFWRHTYDYANTKSFSKLRTICIDDKPQNPDEIIVQCPDQSCRIWLHARCIAAKALERAEASAKSNKKGAKSMPKKRGPKNMDVEVNSPAVTRVGNATSSAEVYIQDTFGAPDIRATEIIINAHGSLYAEDVHCLKCGAAID